MSLLFGKAYFGGGPGIELEIILLHPVAENHAVLRHVGDDLQGTVLPDLPENDVRPGGYAGVGLTHGEVKGLGFPGKILGDRER